MALSRDKLLLYFSLTAAIGISVSFWKVYLFHLLMVLVVISYFLSREKSGSFVQGVRFHYILYLMLAWYSMSMLWSINTAYSAVYVFYIVCGLLLVLSVVKYSRTVEMESKLVSGLSFIFSVEIVISALESVSSFRMPISPYSDYVHYFGRVEDLAYLETISNLYLNLNVPTGFEWNPNNLAILMVILFPFYFFSTNKKKYIGIVLIPFVIYMSESRGAFLAFIGVLLICLTYIASRKLVLYAIAIIPLGLVALYLINLYPEAFENRKYQEMAGMVESIERYFSSEDAYYDSVGIRKELIHNGLDALVDSYGLGVGGGGSVAVQEERGGVAGKYKSMHNFWVEMLVDAGVLFTFIFISWYISLAFRLFQISKRSRGRLRYYSRSLFVSMVGFSVAAVSASSVIYFLPMWLMFGLSIATISNYEREKLDWYKARNKVVNAANA